MRTLQTGGPDDVHSYYSMHHTGQRSHILHITICTLVDWREHTSHSDRGWGLTWRWKIINGMEWIQGSELNLHVELDIWVKRNIFVIYTVLKLFTTVKQKVTIFFRASNCLEDMIYFIFHITYSKMDRAYIYFSHALCNYIYIFLPWL